MKSISVSLLLLFPLCAKAGDVLTASFRDGLDTVQVDLCFEGSAPLRLYRHEEAGSFSAGPFHDGSLLKVSGSGSVLKLPALPENACINWQTDLKAALKKRDYRLILQAGEDLVMSTSLWFWKGPMSRDILVDIELPAGLSISTPWSEMGGAGGKPRFRPDKTSADWESKVALGKFEIDLVTVPGARMRLAAPGDLSVARRIKIRQWIEQTVETVVSVYGYFPQPAPQVLVIPIGPRNEAVLTASVIRGGGTGVVFYIDETRPLQEFMDDWTATHEFSHMLIPYVSSRDRWLSEGLASYYQNVLRARDGRLSATAAWQELYDGFKRGQNGTYGGSLAQATRTGRHSTMRVYWSGAALMLMADIQLRQASGGRQSLDTALQSLAACCISNGKTWRAREMFERLDELTGTHIMTGLYDRYVPAYGFPDLRSTWDDLGISIHHGKVTLLNSAQMSDIRKSIMNG